MSSFDDWLEKRTAPNPAIEDELRPKPKDPDDFDTWLDKKLAFPPPLPGMIPQGEVMPDATGNEYSGMMMGPIAAEQVARTTAGAVVGPFHAVRKGGYVGADVIPATVSGLMSLAELVTPLDAGNFPTHKYVDIPHNYLQKKIAEDAPFKEAGQVAQLVPDWVGVKYPLAGISAFARIPAVAKAGAAIGGPIAKGAAKLAEKVPILQRMAKAGEEAMIARKEEPKLRIVDAYMNVPQAGKALPYIDNPASAPTDVLKQVAKDLQEIREIDLSKWDELSYRSRKRLAQLTNFKGAADAPDAPGRWITETQGNIDAVEDLFKGSHIQSGLPADLMEAYTTGGMGRVENIIDDFIAVSSKDGTRAKYRPKDPLYGTEEVHPFEREILKSTGYIPKIWDSPSAPSAVRFREELLTKIKEIEAKSPKVEVKKPNPAFQSPAAVLRAKANELGLIPSERKAKAAGVPWLEETTPFTTKAPAGGLAKTKADVLAEKLKANPQLKATQVENLVEAVLDKVVRYPILRATEYSVRRPGTKMALAARYADKGVKRFLKGAVPKWVEAGDAEHKALSMEHDFWITDVMKSIVRNSEGDPAKYDQLLNDALSHMAVSGRTLKATGAAPKGTGLSMAERALERAQKTGDPKMIQAAQDLISKAKAYETFRQHRAALRKAGVKEKDLPKWTDPIPASKPRPPTAVPEGEVSPDEMANLFADMEGTAPSPASVTEDLDVAADRLRGTFDTSQVKLAQEVESARSAERLAAGEARLPPPPGPARKLPQDLIDVLDDVKKKWRGRIEDSARWGYLDPETLAKLRNPNELLLDVYRAAHNPKWVNEAKQLDAWDNVKQVLRDSSPKARSGQINAAIKQLLNIEIAQDFEKSGWKAIAGSEKLKQNPILARVLNDRTLRDVLGEEMEHLFGKVTDIKTAMELSGEVLARHRAKLFMNQGLADDMHRMGLLFSSPSEQEGFINVGPYMDRAEKVWAPAAMEDVFKTGENLYRDMTMAYKAYLKTGALWRAGSTAYSPTNIAVGAISNISSGANSGDMFRAQFLPALRTAWKQTRGMMGSNEKIFGKLTEEQRAFEIANARMGLGAGTASGEMGSMLTELGAVPRLGSTQKIPRVLEKMGVSPTNKWARKAVSAKNRAGKFMRDSFQRSDVLFKQTIAQMITADFDEIAKNATPNDVKNIMEGLYGSKDPVTIAANYTANVAQSYSRVSPLFRFLGRGPLAGLFGSFPYESTRNFGHGVNYTVLALRGAAMAESPVVRQILLDRAMRHIVGLTMNMRFLVDMSKIAEETIGPRLSERKRKALHEVALPKYDRDGPSAILKKDRKGNVFYSALQNLEYMQTPNKIINNLGTIASHLVAGPWNQVDEDLMKMAVNLTDDFLQWQQPGKGIAEFLLNQRIQPSIGSVLQEGSERRGVTRLSNNPIKTQEYAERAKKALLPAVIPTPLRQIFDLGEYAAAPEADTESGRSPREIAPVRIKDINTLDEMGKAGFSFGERKGKYSRSIDDILKSFVSPKEKAQAIMALRDDWNNDLGAEMSRQLPQWLALHTYDEVLEAMKTVGHETAEPAMAGRVPNFMLIFEDKIPANIQMRMRRR